MKYKILKNSNFEDYFKYIFYIKNHKKQPDLLPQLDIEKLFHEYYFNKAVICLDISRPYRTILGCCMVRNNPDIRAWAQLLYPTMVNTGQSDWYKYSVNNIQDKLTTYYSKGIYGVFTPK